MYIYIYVYIYIYIYVHLYICIYRYDNYARKHVPGHRMGIISTIKVKHEQDLSTGGTRVCCTCMYSLRSRVYLSLLYISIGVMYVYIYT
jgi:hypothetical protein